MGYRTFEINELPEESDDDYAIEFTTGNARLGLAMSEDELTGAAKAMLETADGRAEAFDGKHASEL